MLRQTIGGAAILVIGGIAGVGLVDRDAPRPSGYALPPDPASYSVAPPAPAANELSLRADRGGHFRLRANVDGEPVEFMIDTGATLVVLSPPDARRIGIDPTRLDYSATATTAGGEVPVAPVVLREVRIGQLSVRDVEAVVNGAPLATSLLGNSFLSRLEGWEAGGGRLVLRW